MNKKVTRLFVLIIAGTSAMFSGCTFIGFAAGLAIDNSSVHKVNLAGVDTLKHGSWLEVELADSTEEDGYFSGTDGSYHSQYPRKYDEARKKMSPGLNLPMLGESDTLVDTAGSSWAAAFAGFELTGDLKPLVVSISGKRRRETPFALLKQFKDSNAAPYDLAKIGPLLVSDIIPVASKGILVRDSTAVRRIDISDVASVKLDDAPKARRMTWLAGIIGGLMVDAVCYHYLIPLLVKHQAQNPYTP